MSEPSQPLMSLGSTDPEVFPTFGLTIIQTNESPWLGKPVPIGFSVLSTMSNQVEAKVLIEFLFPTAAVPLMGIPMNKSHKRGRGSCCKGCCELGTSSTLLACHVNLSGSFLWFQSVYLFMGIMLVCSPCGIYTQ